MHTTLEMLFQANNTKTNEQLKKFKNKILEIINTAAFLFNNSAGSKTNSLFLDYLCIQIKQYKYKDTTTQLQIKSLNATECFTCNNTLLLGSSKNLYSQKSSETYLNIETHKTNLPSYNQDDITELLTSSQLLASLSKLPELGTSKPLWEPLIYTIKKKLQITKQKHRNNYISQQHSPPSININKTINDNAKHIPTVPL